MLTIRLLDADKLHYHRVLVASIKGGVYNGMKSAVVVFADEIDKNKKARVDAVPVVRCKDCKYHYVDGDNVRFNLCLLNHNKVQADDWYCADGKRREEADDER